MASCSKALGAALAMAALAVPAVAQNGPPGPGCWTRTYSEAHLAAHPAQDVRVITAEIEPGGEDDVLYGGLDLELRDGRKFGAAVVCYIDDKKDRRCGIECDGGSYAMRLRESDGTVLLVNDGYGLRMSDCADGYVLPADHEHRLFRMFPCE